MTTENPMLNSVKEAFAPVTEAFKNFQNFEVPEAAREFVKKQTETAKERAADFYAGSEKATDAIESVVAGSVSEVAKISRNIQQAIYQDAEAFLAGIDKLASAKSLNEAVQIQSDLLRSRGEVFVSRAKARLRRRQDRAGQLRQGLQQDCLIASVSVVLVRKARVTRAFFLRADHCKQRASPAMTGDGILQS
jgi:phasin